MNILKAVALSDKEIARRKAISYELDSIEARKLVLRAEAADILNLKFFYELSESIIHRGVGSDNDNYYQVTVTSDGKTALLKGIK
jgi:hypothetical protein